MPSADAQLLSVPPLTVTSSATKLALLSLSVKVMVSLPDAPSTPVPARLIATVGGVLVSIFSSPALVSLVVLPAASITTALTL